MVNHIKHVDHLLDLQQQCSKASSSHLLSTFSPAIGRVHFMDHFMVTRIIFSCGLLQFKCSGSHITPVGPAVFYFCLYIAYIQGFNMMVTTIVCGSLCDLGACANLGYSHYAERTCKKMDLV